MKTQNPDHPLRRTLRHLVLASMMAAANAMMLGSADAAPITWNPIQNATGLASDVVTTGTFFDSAAAYAGANVTLNGVTFKRKAQFGRRRFRRVGQEEDFFPLKC